MVWYIGGGRRRRSTAHHATPLPRHNSTGESKTNFEWDRWLSVGCQAGPSTPCIPLIVGSRCRGNSRQAAEVQRAGSLPRSSSVMRARRYTQEDVGLVAVVPKKYRACCANCCALLCLLCLVVPCCALLCLVVPLLCHCCAKVSHLRSTYG